MSEHLPSGRRGQMLALALTVVLAASVWVAAVSPLMAWYDARSARLADGRRMVARMAAMAATVPALLREAAAARTSAAASRAIALEAPSDAVAGATLQQRMQDLATAAGITLSSVETLPAEQQGSYRRISLRVTCAAPWPVLIGLLEAMEDSTPRMLVDDLDLNPAPDLVHPSGMAIGANFTVVAFRPGTAP